VLGGDNSLCGWKRHKTSTPAVLKTVVVLKKAPMSLEKISVATILYKIMMM